MYRRSLANAFIFFIEIEKNTCGWYVYCGILLRDIVGIVDLGGKEENTDVGKNQKENAMDCGIRSISSGHFTGK